MKGAMLAGEPAACAPNRGVCCCRLRPPDTDKLDLIQRGMSRRLEQMGRRDGLVVRWSACQHAEDDMQWAGPN